MTQDKSSAAIKPILLGIARPILAWTIHFIFVYGALSATCTERGVFSYGTVLIAIGIATIVAVVIAGWSLFHASATEFHVAARWTTIISLVAILFNVLPLLLLSGCG